MPDFVILLFLRRYMMVESKIFINEAFEYKMHDLWLLHKLFLFILSVHLYLSQQIGYKLAILIRTYLNNFIVHIIFDIFYLILVQIWDLHTLQHQMPVHIIIYIFYLFIGFQFLCFLIIENVLHYF